MVWLLSQSANQRRVLRSRDPLAPIIPGRGDLKPRVWPHHGLKFLSQPHVFPNHVLMENRKYQFLPSFWCFSNVYLESRNPVVTENKPKLECAKPFAQRNLPMLNKESLNQMIYCFTHHVVNSQASVLVLEIQGLNIECSVQRPTVLNPRKHFSV